MRTGATGTPTIQIPGGLQALRRSQSVLVEVAGRYGAVRRPNIVGALTLKAAAHSAVSDPHRGRHRADFATLSALVAASDLTDETLSKGERRRLRTMIAATLQRARRCGQPAGADDGLRRIARRLG